MVVLNIYSAVSNMYSLDKKMEGRWLITVNKWEISDSWYQLYQNDNLYYTFVKETL